MKIFLRISIVAALALGLSACVSLSGYRAAKSRMLYLEYERVNGPMQAPDTTKIAIEQE